jgi:hypothetical protein
MHVLQVDGQWMLTFKNPHLVFVCFLLAQAQLLLLPLTKKVPVLSLHSLNIGGFVGEDDAVNLQTSHVDGHSV